MTPTILIATTNPDKYREIKHAWADLSVTFVSLQDIDLIPEPEETEATIEGNAMLKARYYATKSGLITLSDDSGLFVHGLAGWPGVTSARIAPNNDERRKLVLDRMTHLKDVSERAASFRTALALFDPFLKTYHVVIGEDTGEIVSTLPEDASEKAFCYDPIFFAPDIQKTYGDISVAEKNARSSRGKALAQMAYHLANTYAYKQVFVPLAIIIKNGKILMNLRHDPHSPQYDNKWEFPGGGIQQGETVEEALQREVKEETGYTVKIIQQCKHIHLNSTVRGGRDVAIYLIPFLCEIVGGSLELPPNEVVKSDWFSPDDIPHQDLIAKNQELYTIIYPEIVAFIQSHHNA